VSAVRREWAWPALAIAPMVLVAVASGRAGPPTVLVAAAAALLWPVLAARHGRGIALATLVALVYGTVAYGLALDTSWDAGPPFAAGGAAPLAFAVAAALVRLAWGRSDTNESQLPRLAALAIGVAALAPTGVALGFVPLAAVLQRSRVPRPRRVVWIVAAAVAAGVLAARGAGPEAVLDGLFSSWSGLLFWSPVLWLGLVGCLRERPARRRGRDAQDEHRRIHFGGAPRRRAATPTNEPRRIHFGGAEDPAAALGPALLVAAAVGAVTLDVGPYRGVRFAPVLPLLALGLARALDGIRSLALHRPLVPVATGIAALAAWNALLMAQYLDGRIPRDDTVSFPRIARNAAATVSAAVGSPTAWPANWIFAARHHVSAARYDLLGGVDLFGPLAPGSALGRGPLGLDGVIDVGHLRTDEALLQSGWSVRHPCGVEVCRAVLGTAELVAPIREPRDVDVMLTAAGAGTLTMAVNGVPVLSAALAADVKTHFVRLPRARLRRGLNAIVFTIPPGGRALVDRIVFTPVEGPRSPHGGTRTRPSSGGPRSPHDGTRTRSSSGGPA